MSVINTQPLAGASGNQVTGYNLTKSLRFRGSASGALTRTPGTTGNQRTFTWSGWVKRGSLGTNTLFDAFYGGSTRYDVFYFNSSDNLRFFGGVYSTGASTTTSVDLVTTQVFRDPSAWYHIVLAVDTTQATASNRVKIYVNGVQVTSFSTSTYPTQNDQTYYNVTTTGMSIGSDTANSFIFDGYMADVISVDGQQLTPSSFGETDSITGVWKPKAFSGTYGTNGFYLPFTDVATTSGSNAGLGKDFSGNGNYWNTNNISVTTGSTYDSMADVPTLTSSTVANYCTLNPLDNLGSTVVDGNLGFTTATTSTGNLNATIWTSSGKWYYEVVTTNLPAEFTFGITSKDSGQSITSGRYGFDGNPFLVQNSAYNAGGFTFASNDVLGVAYDLGAGTIAGYKNGVLQTTLTGVPAGTYTPFVADSTSGATGCTGYINFGQRAFAYTPPTGYKALNTYNLPDSTIVAGNKYMDATTYTANNSTQTIVNAGGFKPDFVWEKSRANAYSHQLFDSVRGVGKYLYSDQTAAEGTNAASLTSFNSNGYSVGATDNANLTNGTASVGWQWQAGQGTTSSNTNGSITSTVSVNATAGFSVVTFTAQSSGSGTVGHGLGVAPKFIITKSRTQTYGWAVYHTSIGNTGYVTLNTTNAVTTNAIWNNTSPTSSVFSLGSDFAGNDSCVAYCWAEIAGFSKFGTYVGNGSTDGPFVYTGFRPKFVMYKSTASGNGWVILDSSRSSYNLAVHRLLPNLSDAEYTSVGYNNLDFVSNGFKVRSTSTDQNNNGDTYIYIAFAENPFKNSLAR